MLVFLINIIICLFVMRTLCTAVLMVFLLSACGLKGPLYLPQPETAPQSADQSKKK
jgi:predicted small lipoprotein YifL